LVVDFTMMTRRYTSILFTFAIFTFALTACVRAASTAPTPAPRSALPAPQATLAAAQSNQPCRSADLETSSNSSVANEAITIGVTLMNRTGYACQLQGAPQVELLGADNNPLPIQYTAAALNQTPPLPTTLNITPGESAIVSMAWSNACPPLPEKISLRLTLANGETLAIAPENLPTPPCSDKSQPATLIVSPYSYPP
jgi:hypothetical protein